MFAHILINKISCVRGAQPLQAPRLAGGFASHTRHRLPDKIPPTKIPPKKKNNNFILALFFYSYIVSVCSSLRSR